MTYDPTTEAATLESKRSPCKGKATENGKATAAAPAQEASPPTDQAPGEPPAASGSTDDASGEGNDPPPRSGTVIVELPIEHCDPGFATPRFDFRATPRQAAAAKVLWCSLQKNGARFRGGPSSHADGAPVENQHGGIRWLLDRLADAIEQETGKDLTSDFGLVFR